jgi:hypothetical protein
MVRSRHPLVAGFGALALSLGSAQLAGAQVLAPNLIYTSVQPCRLFDTRFATNGTNHRLAHGAAQTFNVIGANVTSTTFTGQGGNNGGCAIPGFDVNHSPQAQAVVLNFVAVGPSGAGDLRAWPTDQALPNASIINYSTAVNIANGIVVPVRQDQPGGDISIRADVADADVLADVVGYFAAVTATQGFNNVFLGPKAGNSSATGFSNTGYGINALGALTNASFNTAFGINTLGADTTGSSNTAVGDSALATLTSGGDNTGVGRGALHATTSGVFNVALGSSALAGNTIGGFDTAVGESALFANTTGGNNTAVGVFALVNLTTGTNNVALGDSAGSNITSGNHNVDIEASPGANESATLRIGTPGTQTATFIAGIDGATSAGGTAVLVNSSGALGTMTSALRFKEDVQEMGEASAGLIRLRPVTFHYKPAYDDGSRLLQYGLIAEEVAQVYPGLVEYDRDGAPLAVRYHFVNAMLLNEVQRQQRTIAELQAQAADERTRLAEQQAELAEQRARLAEQQRLAERQEARLRRLEAVISAHR